MRRSFLSLLAVFLLPCPAEAQRDWEAYLQTDLVAIRGGRMILDEYTLDRIALPGLEEVNVKVHFHTEAPADGSISRDNFVALSVVASTHFMPGYYASLNGVTMGELLDVFSSQDLEVPIGDPDIEVTMIMTSSGVQVEMIDNATGWRHRETETWEEFFSG